MQTIAINVNGKDNTVEVPEDTPLLYVLRNDLELNGPKFGCGLAQCGACTVLIDGEPTRSCVTPISSIENSKVATLESLGTLEKPGAMQQAFIDEQAAQCGYCINGMMMAATALLEKNPKPDKQEIKEALNNNLCRCGSHLRIIRAIENVANQS